MIRSGRWAVLICLYAVVESAQSQDASVPEGPSPRETFEVDTDRDGIPDGWYNLRDAKIVDHGRGSGPGAKCLRFENARAGRPARASRAFGVDGREIEAILVGVWVRAEEIVSGERSGDDPGLVIDFLSDPLQLRTVRRGNLGPWKTIGREWTHVAKRMPIPPDTRLAILSTGLIGATGVLEVDDLTIELIPVGGTSTANLVFNGDFELGDPEATGWTLDRGTHRVMGGYESPASVELKGAGARAYAGLGLPVGRIKSLEVSVVARGNGLRGANGGLGLVFFLDDEGRPLPGTQDGVQAMTFAGSFGWTPTRGRVDVPPGAIRALVHFEKPSAYGTLNVDDVRVIAGDGEVRWTPYHVETLTTGWVPVKPSPGIVAGSALDASNLLDAPAGKHGFVVVRDGRLAFEKGERARFFGVSLLAPTAFLDPSKADALVDRLARSGVNLIRLAELDTPLGPARSLFDDSRDDTQALDLEAMARLDHLIAAASARGIYVAIELQGARRFRDGDTSVADGRKLPSGGGPAAAFDPQVRAAALAAANLLLNHKNPETGRTLRDEPSLAWFTLAGELSLFDMAEAPERDSKATLDALRASMRKNDVPNAGARRVWEKAESNQWTTLAGEVRKLGLRVPIAGGSHWKRDHDYSAAQAASGLDLIDDRLYYNAPGWINPDHRSLLWARDALVGMAKLKRKPDRPYVVGQWAVPSFGAWAMPFEGADLILAAAAASVEDWDALIRRAVFLFPDVWGASASGIGGGEDIFNIPEVVNGIPQTFALLPHAASILRHSAAGGTGRSGKPANSKGGVPGLDPRGGRLVVETPHTRGLAGWAVAGGIGAARFDGLSVNVAGPSGVVLVSSLGPEPIASSSRLLVTAVGRVEPTGFRFQDDWRREPGDPGRPPLLHEGIPAQITWTRTGTVKAYALDNTGARVAPARVEKVEGPGGGYRLAIDGRTPSLHWEMIVE